MTDRTVLNQIGNAVDMLDTISDAKQMSILTGVLANNVRGMRYARGEIDAIEAETGPERKTEEIVGAVKRHAREVLLRQGDTTDVGELSYLAKAFKDLGCSLAWLRGEVTIDFDAAIAYLHATLEKEEKEND